MAELDSKLLHELFEYRDGSLFRKKTISSRAKISQEVGCLNDRGYKIVSVNGKLQKVHRLIFLMHHDWLPKEIDHIDNNKINNKIENLRAANRLENLSNLTISAKNTSGVKNVTWDKNRKKWHVQIHKNNKNLHFGRFDKLEEAKAIAFQNRVNLCGEFANHG